MWKNAFQIEYWLDNRYVFVTSPLRLASTCKESIKQNSEIERERESNLLEKIQFKLLKFVKLLKSPPF